MRGASGDRGAYSIRRAPPTYLSLRSRRAPPTYLSLRSQRAPPTYLSLRSRHAPPTYLSLRSRHIRGESGSDHRARGASRLRGDCDQGISGGAPGGAVVGAGAAAMSRTSSGVPLRTLHATPNISPEAGWVMSSM